MVSEDSSPGNDNSLVSSIITGYSPTPRQPIITERNSHMVEPIMDTLAIGVLFEQLDANIGLDGFNALFSAASASPETSEEHLVDALTKLLLNRTEKLPIKDIRDDPFGKVWISPGDFSKRTPLDNRTVEIENKIKKLKNSGKTLDLTLLIAQDTEAIVTLPIFF